MSDQIGGAPVGVFYTNDCRGIAEGLEARGGQVGAVCETGDDTTDHVEDCNGNRFAVVELLE